MQWQPNAKLVVIKRRAQLLAAIRQFFAERNVLEVETPLLCAHSVTDPYIASIAVFNAINPHQHPHYYLQTSPEYAMKRVLAAYGSELGDGIYQLSKAFRQDSCSARHNPEFTLLEWYRPGFTLHDLIDEVAQLLTAVYAQSGQTLDIHRVSYQGLFESVLGLNPHTASVAELLLCAKPWLPQQYDELDKKDVLELLFSFAIEPTLLVYPVLFVTDYPECMAALAQLQHDSDYVTASRFELYLNGMEVANGYHELTDVATHVRRFTADQARRCALGLPAIDIDQRFVAAMAAGLPACSGVALGVDRLLMALSGNTIQEVLIFSFDHA